MHGMQSNLSEEHVFLVDEAEPLFHQAVVDCLHIFGAPQPLLHLHPPLLQLPLFSLDRAQLRPQRLQLSLSLLGQLLDGGAGDREEGRFGGGGVGPTD